MRATRREKKQDTGELLARLLAAVTESYPNDSTKPGVVMSRIDKDEVYASICRYSMGRKDVVASFRAATTHECLLGLTRSWLGVGVARIALMKIVQ